MWWGAGHAAMLLVIGLPLIFFKSELPAWLETGAEKAVGIVILLLAARVIVKWLRGDLRRGARARHHHAAGRAADDGHAPAPPAPRRQRHHHRHVRTPQQAFGIGVLHGLAGTGAVVLLLIAALPTQLEAAAALAVFAPMSVLSMALCTEPVRVGADAADRRACLPHGADTGARHVRAHVRRLVRRLT